MILKVIKDWNWIVKSKMKSDPKIITIVKTAIKTTVKTTAEANQCLVIGVLDNAMQGLSIIQQQAIQQADQIIAASRTIHLFQSEFKKGSEFIDLTGKMQQLPKMIKTSLDNKKQVVVLATGDPLCHGIGHFLIKKLGKKSVQILANLSIVQLAFSHLGEPWQSVKICSVHTKDTGEWNEHSTSAHGMYPLLQTIKNNDLLAVYTSPDNSPQRIARMLVTENMAEQYEFSVFEKLLQNEEKITTGLSANQVIQSNFAEPNLLVIKRNTPVESAVLFGHHDDFYAQRKPEKGLITRCDVRAVVLAKMQLQKNSIVWDIGAGSGSVGLEAASLCEQGYVYAIEKNCDDLSLIKANRKKMQLINYSIVCGKAPEKMDQWPQPDAVFIGGSADQLKPLITMICQKLNPGGSLVMNFITLENLNQSIEILKTLNLEWELTQLQMSHSKPILKMNRLQADNLVWIVSVSLS